jgi:hypothetical protein
MSDVTGLNELGSLEAVFQFAIAPEKYSGVGHLIMYILPRTVTESSAMKPIIISLLMSLLLEFRISLWITHKENGPPCGPSADRWILTTANTAGTLVLAVFAVVGLNVPSEARRSSR